MNRFFLALFVLLASIASKADACAMLPAITNITTVMAVTRVEWPADGNGYSRCVSFTDGGYKPGNISPWYVSVKYWEAPSQFVSYSGLLAPDRHYNWKISNGVLYLYWQGSNIEVGQYPLHPYGTDSNYGYVIQVTRPDVVVTVDGLPGSFVVGGKVPLIPISGGSGSFTFSGPSDMTGHPDTDTGIWFRPIVVKKIVP